MIKHLPECWAKHDSDPPAWCICDELRACEARVREDERSNNFTPDDFSEAMTDSYRRGLDAAREAAAAVEGGYSVPPEMPVGAFVKAMRREYLAAIDALRKANDD